MKNPTIKKSEDVIYADDKAIKTLSHDDLEKNFVLFKLPNDPNGFVVFPSDSYYLYLMENEDEALKLKNNERGFPMFPIHRPVSIAFGSDGFKTFWKHPESHGVIGCIWLRFRHYEESRVKEKHIYVEMMGVRKGYTRNNINRLMLNKSMKHFDIYKVDFGLTTPTGEKFARAFDAETGNRVKYYAPNPRTRQK